MPAPDDSSRTATDGGLRRDVRFPDTRWSLISDVQAPSAHDREEALAELCRLYWYPVYAFARSRGCDPHHAADLTQDLFLKFLRNESFQGAKKEKGKLRTYLLTAMSRLIANEARRAAAGKRAPERLAVPIEQEDAEFRLAQEASWSSGLPPDRQFDRRWAEALLLQVERRLRDEHIASGKEVQFEALKPFISGDGSGDGYDGIASRLAMSEGAVKVAVHRLRKRFKMVLRDEISSTLREGEDVDGELRHLYAALSGQ